MTWSKFNQGSTIGARGSEGGMIMDDQEHDLGARITLERACRQVPFAITCGIYGAVVLTVYVNSEAEASRLTTEIRRELDRILRFSQSADANAVRIEISTFVQRYQ